MRRVSFSHTQEPMRLGAAAARASADGFAGMVDGGKDVTRRRAWHWATRGLYVLAVSKCMGLRRGEVAEVFGVIEIVDVSRGPLLPLSARDVVREGFPGMTPEAFAAKFLRIAGGGDPFMQITRVEFRHVDALRVASAWAALSLDQRHAFADRTRAA